MGLRDNYISIDLWSSSD